MVIRGKIQSKDLKIEHYRHGDLLGTASIIKLMRMPLLMEPKGME